MDTKKRRVGSFKIAAFFSQSYGTLFCIKGACACYIGGTYIAMAGAAGSLDHLLGEPFFCELPIMKGPAHGLKNSCRKYTK
jgi:hypothetical protein